MTDKNENINKLYTLHEVDGRAVDKLLAQRAPAQPPQPPEPPESPEVSPPTESLLDAARLRQAEALFQVLEHCPAPDPPLDLTHRTLQRLSRAASSPGRAARHLAEFWSEGPSLRLGELAAVAAVVVIGLSLLLPVLGRARDEARRTQCLDNLHQAGMALASYANDFNDQMPRYNLQPNLPWWHIGQPFNAQGLVESNSANLYKLVRGGYLRTSDLACPENMMASRRLSADTIDWPSVDAVSYSYQNQYAAEPIHLSRVRSMAVLADRNPLFNVRSEFGSFNYHFDLPADSASMLHGGRGQNILMTGGGAFWDREPLLPNGDNIWLIRGVTEYMGTEAPTDPGDSFLVP